MPKILAAIDNLTREEWLELRRQGIGGSDAPAIAGLSPFRSAISVYLEKIGAVSADELAGDEQKEEMYWGTRLEDIVAEEFSARTGLELIRPSAIFCHPDHPFMIANIDRIITDPANGYGVLEIKTTNPFNEAAWEDGIPEHVIIQVQHYLAVTGYKYGYAAVLIGGQKYLHKLIPRDDEVINYLIEIERKFWQMVEDRTPPPLDGSEDASNILKLLYPVADPGSKILLPPEAEDLIREYEEAKAQEKAAGERKEAAANRLKALLGTNEAGIAGRRIVTWKTVNASRFDQDTFKSEHPELYQQYLKPAPYRRFGIK
ncbi:MAG: YqaJ viral recombinase family protein [Desulfotomaculales bacterium]